MTRTRYMPELLTAKQAAQEVGRSVATISTWASEGLIEEVDRQGPRGSSRFHCLAIVAAANAKGADIRVALDRLQPSIREEWDALPETESGNEDVPDLQEERALHERRKRELTEIKLAAARAELLPADTVRAVYGSVGAMVREKVMAIEISAVTHLDEHGLAWLREELRSVLTQIVRDAERMSEPLYERQIEDDADA
jgi:hypothetical protein